MLLLAAVVGAAAERPNILFIMTDDHAAHAISAYGSTINHTPRIDRLAKEGMRFANCFCTNSICGPSRATILTGKYSHKNGFALNGPKFDGSQPHVGKHLQSAGYETAIIGKWHLGSDPTGFGHWEILPGQGDYDDPVFLTAAGRKREKGYVTDLITDKAIAYLKDRPKGKPFFLMVHHKAPHREWTPAARHASLYEDVSIPEPPTFHDDYAGRPAAKNAEMRISRDLTKADLKVPPPEGLSEAERTSWNYQRYIKDYLRCVAAVDESVGRLLDALDEMGLAENTAVFYTSDQGFYLGDHGWYDKRFMYEPSLRMPLLVRFPGRVPAGSLADAMVTNVDFAETFLDLAGARIPPEMQGRSIFPILEGNPPADWRKVMYYRYYEFPVPHRVEPHFGVRTERYKLLYFPQLDHWEFFDLETDPHELRNRYDDPAAADQIAALKGEIKRLQKELGDDGQVKVRE